MAGSLLLGYHPMSELKSSKNYRVRGFPWLKASILVLIGGGLGLCFTGFPAKLKRGLREIFAPKSAIVAVNRQDIYRQAEAQIRAEMEAKYERDIAALKNSLADVDKQPAKPAAVPEPELGPVTDLRKLRSGIAFKTTVNLQKGGLASRERMDDSSYTASYQLSLRIPIPAKTLSELETSSPELSKMLPGLSALVEKAELSSGFAKLYANKAERVRRDANLLNELLTKHNIYDCETILNLKTESGRRVFFMQADMDVVADGSDGDRLATMPPEIVDSPNYQPFTSYGWAKKTPVPNPIVQGWEQRISVAQKELATAATPVARKIWLRNRIQYLKRGIEDLKNRSFLIADYDPFIVIPVDLLSSNDAFAPKTGDYAVIIYDKKLYPAIVGDGGPTSKVGEGSLRLARELNPKASAYNRPVSDLKVSYLVFPGSHESEHSAPDYDKWHLRCQELLTEMGGIGVGYTLHQWQDLLPKSPVVTPPTPASVAPAPAIEPE